jgi:hypothetical protein
MSRVIFGMWTVLLLIFSVAVSLISPHMISAANWGLFFLDILAILFVVANWIAWFIKGYKYLDMRYT